MTQKIKKLPAVSFIIVALICICSCIIFAGCSVSAPVISVDGSVISWDNVRNATSYEVDINGNTIEVTDNSFNVIPYIQSSNTTKEIRVRAITSNRFLSNSSYSDTVRITAGNTKLSTPANFAVTASSTSCLLTWDKVVNSDSYCIRAVNTENYEEYYIYTTTNSINLNNRLDTSGEFMVSVFAYSNEELETYAPSDYSESLPIVVDVTLDTPTNLSIVQTNGNIIVSWNRVDGASSYKVSVLGGETFTVNAGTSSKLQSVNLSNRGVTLNNGETLFVNVSACGADNSGYISSPYSDMVALYSGGSLTDYANVKYDFESAEVDLVADSYNEFVKIVRFGIFYRIVNMQVFINYEYTNLNYDYVQAVSSYDEIMYISYRETMQSLGNKHYGYDMTFYHTNYPDKTADLGNNISVQSTEVQPSSYTSTPRDADFEDFAINDRTEEMMVYNSDQLYYAIEYGCKPIFPEGDSPAKTAYETAKDVLREIVSDDMTDYEKALAIFDWLCYTVHYDYDLVELNEILGKSTSPWEIHDYRGFYIEGVFYDGGQAVCDGIAKTYALLCGIEGIECYKVSGYGGSAAGFDYSKPEANHAWNKIKLDLNNDGEGEWYTVDATWNDYYSVTQSNGVLIYTEYLNHSFFLHSDSWLSVNENNQIHVELGAPASNTAVTPFDYYTYTKYDGENDILIEDSQELRDLAEYMKNTNGQSIEFASTSRLSQYVINEVFRKDINQEPNYFANTFNTENGTTYYVYLLYY